MSKTTRPDDNTVSALDKFLGGVKHFYDRLGLARNLDDVAEPLREDADGSTPTRVGKLLGLTAPHAPRGRIYLKYMLALESIPERWFPFVIEIWESFSRVAEDAARGHNDPTHNWQFEHALEMCPKHMEPKADEKLAPLDKNDVAILDALVDKFPVTVNQYALETATDLNRKTIGKSLASLEKAKYVDRPKGKNSGCTLTDAGLKIAKRCGIKFPEDSP